ncbi:MAG TPA: PepSY-like domain-containing protein [Nitrospiraceae bacterium]|nr:PepSY-like domain-containing protein [Nitrospiraceae bacterium]
MSFRHPDKRALILALPLAMTLAAASVGHASFLDSKVQWSALPASVQKTITTHNAGGKVDEIEKESRGNWTVYKAKIRTPGDTGVKMNVREDGRLMEFDSVSREAFVPWSEVPATVQKSITSDSAGGKVTLIEKVTSEGRTVYKAKVEVPDATVVKMKVGEDGKLLELDTDREWF